VRTLSQAAAIAAALLLSACSSMPSMNPMDWFGSGPTGPKPAELPVLTNAQGVKVLWSASIGSAEGFFFTPALVGDGIYAASRSGTVARLDAATGQPKWRVSVGKRISSGVGSDGTLAVVASDDGEVVALDAKSGVVRWRSRVSSEVLAQPKVSEGAGAGAQRRTTRSSPSASRMGNARWVYQRPAAALIVRSPVGLTAQQGAVFAGFSGGKLVAISLADGLPRWEATVALPKGATELERVTDIVGEPYAQGREVCTAAYQGRVACYDMQTTATSCGRAKCRRSRAWRSTPAMRS
jgi:outer membrane protein assembly factor BamB